MNRCSLPGARLRQAALLTHIYESVVAAPLGQQRMMFESGDDTELQQLGRGSAPGRLDSLWSSPPRAPEPEPEPEGTIHRVGPKFLEV